jgi:hypothetical protein
MDLFNGVFLSEILVIFLVATIVSALSCVGLLGNKYPNFIFPFAVFSFSILGFLSLRWLSTGRDDQEWNRVKIQ